MDIWIAKDVQHVHIVMDIRGKSCARKCHLGLGENSVSADKGKTSPSMLLYRKTVGFHDVK